MKVILKKTLRFMWVVSLLFPYVSYADPTFSSDQVLLSRQIARLVELYGWSLHGEIHLKKRIEQIQQGIRVSPYEDIPSEVVSEEIGIFPQALFNKWIQEKNLSFSIIKSNFQKYVISQGVDLHFFKAQWNSFFVVLLGTFVNRFQMALSQNSNHVETIRAYYAFALYEIFSHDPDLRVFFEPQTTCRVEEDLELLYQGKEIPKDIDRLFLGKIKTFLSSQGIGSLSYQQFMIRLRELEGRERHLLNIATMVFDHGYDEKKRTQLGPSLEEFKRWDEVLGPWKTDGESEFSHEAWFQKLHLYLKNHNDALQEYLRIIKNRGVIDYYFETKNDVEIEQAQKNYIEWGEMLRRLSPPKYMIDAIHARRMRVLKEESRLVDQDKKEVIAAYIGASALPVLFLAVKASVAAGVVMGFSKTAAVGLFVGVPLAVGALKGTSHFIYYGIKDPRNLTPENFFNDLIPQLTYALPWAAIGPLILPKLGAKVLTVMLAAAVASTTYQGAQGMNEIQRGNQDQGAILLLDSTIHLATLLGLVYYASSIPPQQHGTKIDTPIFPKGFNGPGSGGIGNPPTFSTRSLGKSSGNSSTQEKTSADTRLLEKTTPSVGPMTEQEFKFGIANVLKEEPMYPKTQSLPVKSLWITPQTGFSTLDDGMEEIEIVRRDDRGNIISRRIVKIKKGSTEKEIRKNIPLTAQDEILGLRPRVNKTPLEISPQASSGKSAGRGGESSQGSVNPEEEEKKILIEELASVVNKYNKNENDDDDLLLKQELIQFAQRSPLHRRVVIRYLAETYRQVPDEDTQDYVKDILKALDVVLRINDENEEKRGFRVPIYIEGLINAILHNLYLSLHEEIGEDIGENIRMLFVSLIIDQEETDSKILSRIQAFCTQLVLDIAGIYPEKKEPIVSNLRQLLQLAPGNPTIERIIDSIVYRWRSSEASLIRDLSSPNMPRQVEAILALKVRKVWNAVEHLIPLLSETKESLAMYAQKAILDLGQESLEEGVINKNPKIRRHIIEAVKKAYRECKDPTLKEKIDYLLAQLGLQVLPWEGVVQILKAFPLPLPEGTEVSNGHIISTQARTFYSLWFSASLGEPEAIKSLILFFEHPNLYHPDNEEVLIKLCSFIKTLSWVFDDQKQDILNTLHELVNKSGQDEAVTNIVTALIEKIQAQLDEPRRGFGSAETSTTHFPLKDIPRGNFNSYSWPSVQHNERSTRFTHEEREALQKHVETGMKLYHAGNVESALEHLTDEQKLQQCGLSTYRQPDRFYVKVLNDNLETMVYSWMHEVDPAERFPKRYVYDPISKSICFNLIYFPSHLYSLSSQELAIKKRILQRQFELVLEEIVHALQEAFGQQLSKIGRDYEKVMKTFGPSYEVEIPILFSEWGIYLSPLIWQEYGRREFIQSLIHTTAMPAPSQLDEPRLDEPRRGFREADEKRRELLKFSHESEFPRLIEIIERYGNNHFVIALSEVLPVKKTALFHAVNDWWSAREKSLAISIPFDGVKNSQDALLALGSAIVENSRLEKMPDELKSKVEAVLFKEGAKVSDILSEISTYAESHNLKILLSIQDGQVLLNHHSLQEVNQAILSTPGLSFLLECTTADSSFEEQRDHILAIDPQKKIHIFEVHTRRGSKPYVEEKETSDDNEGEANIRSVSDSNKSPLTTEEKKLVDEKVYFSTAAKADIDAITDPKLKNIIYRKLLLIAKDPVHSGNIGWGITEKNKGVVHKIGFSYAGTSYRVIWTIEDGKPHLVIVGTHENIYDEMKRRLK